MIRTIKQRWQQWLDGTTEPVFPASEQSDPDPLPLGEGVTVVGRPDPYRQLAVFGRKKRPELTPVPVPVIPAIPVFELADPHHVEPAAEFTLATPAQREYEQGLSEWARQALAEMDEVVGIVLREETTEVRTPQYVRRHRRNLAETMGDVGLLGEPDGADLLLESMIKRARRASAPEITGVIPAVGAGPVTEEAWA